MNILNFQNAFGVWFIKLRLGLVLFLITGFVNAEEGNEPELEAQKIETIPNGGNVIEFTALSFEADVPNKPHFVMFYAPWCGHCIRLHPTWDQLGEKYNTDTGVVGIGKVDCTQQTALCATHEVNGYPTLKFFAKGAEGSVKYRGQRDLDALEKFIAEQLGLEYEINEDDVPKPLSGLVEFTDTLFTENVKSGHFFVKFYAPWCGHCQRLAPTWDELAKSFEHDRSVVIGKLDCTKFKSICNDYEVKGYPTLLWIEDGKKMAKYAGDRSHEDLKRFVVEQLGERREEKVEEEVIPVQSVVTLTGENFENAIAHGLTFVKYYAPWCGHCKRLAPTYEELGKKFVAFDGVTIGKVDCTQDINRALCSEQQVNGFPTLHLYKDGEKELEYSGDRSLNDMADFVLARMNHDEL